MGIGKSRITGGNTRRGFRPSVRNTVSEGTTRRPSVVRQGTQQTRFVDGNATQQNMMRPTTQPRQRVQRTADVPAAQETRKPNSPMAEPPQIEDSVAAKEANNKGLLGGLSGLLGGAGETVPSSQPRAPKEKASSLGGLFERLGKVSNTLSEVGGIENAAKVLEASKASPEERKALEYVSKMLEPNKLGGADRTFNDGDKQAIVQALLRDAPGLKQEVTQQLLREGKPMQARLAARAIDGARGPLVRMARKKVFEQAPQQIGQQLTQGLRNANIDPATAQQPDMASRQLTFGELREFERSTSILQQMQKRVGDALGKDISFPGGVSQESIQHSLNGTLGLPPGIVLTPR